MSRIIGREFLGDGFGQVANDRRGEGSAKVLEGGLKKIGPGREKGQRKAEALWKWGDGLGRIFRFRGPMGRGRSESPASSRSRVGENVGRGDREAEGAALEMPCTVTRTAGSNPALSAFEEKSGSKKSVPRGRRTFGNVRGTRVGRGDGMGKLFVGLLRSAGTGDRDGCGSIELLASEAGAALDVQFDVAEVPLVLLDGHTQGR